MRKLTSSIGVAMLCFGMAGTATAATYSFSSTDTPLPISDGEYTDAYITLIDNIDVTGDITDVNVYVDINHTSISDLDIYIGHQEEGKSSWKWVQLYVYNDAISYLNDMTQVTFDDEADTYINDATPPYGPGSFKPSSNGPDSYSDSNLLSYFDGDLAAGEWWFYVYDNATEDGGTLNAFQLEIETDAPNPVPLPGAVVLLGSGLSALAAFRRAKHK